MRMEGLGIEGFFRGVKGPAKVIGEGRELRRRSQAQPEQSCRPGAGKASERSGMKDQRGMAASHCRRDLLQAGQG